MNETPFEMPPDRGSRDVPPPVPTPLSKPESMSEVTHSEDMATNSRTKNLLVTVGTVFVVILVVVIFMGWLGWISLGSFGSKYFGFPTPSVSASPTVSPEI